MLTPEMRSARDLAREHTVAAVAKLKKLMDKADDQAVQMRAADSLLDRGHGRPALSVELSGPEGGPIVIKLLGPGDTVPEGYGI